MSYLYSGRACASGPRHLVCGKHHEQDFTRANLPIQARWLAQGHVAEGNQAGLWREVVRGPQSECHAPRSDQRPSAAGFCGGRIWPVHQRDHDARSCPSMWC